MLNLQEQVAADLEAVFFNAPAMEFVTTHKIKGIRGISSAEHECQVIVDSERYLDRNIRGRVEGVNLEGLVFSIKKSDWLERFKHIPKIDSALLFDGRQYLVDAVSDEMGMLEFTLESLRGR